MDHTEDAHMQGRVYHVIAKVTYEESRHKNTAERQEKLEEAIAWYEKAKERLTLTQAYVDVADVYGGWALTLEELGRVPEAIDCWRAGYAVLHQPVTVA